MERDYDSWTVVQLKDELRNLDASVTGNKSELIQRLQDAKKGKPIKPLRVKTPIRIGIPIPGKDYSKMKVVKLKDELRQRGFSEKGLKKDLIERLEEADKQKVISKRPRKTYFDILPKDILRYEFPFTDPRDLRLRCRQEQYKLLCQNDKVLEEYLEGRGLGKYIKNVNDGLEWAAEIGSLDFVDYFIKNGATNFDLAMEGAAGGGHRDIVELMIEKGSTDFDCEMVEAAGEGHQDLVGLMIKKGATNFDLAMAKAAEGGRRDLVELMIEKGATDFDWAMGWAAKEGQLDIVKLMIKKGGTDFDFDLAMAWAALRGDRDIVELMIKNGARDFNGAMASAARGGHQDIVEYLRNVKERRREEDIKTFAT